jgi:hypothetical protein
MPKFGKTTEFGAGRKKHLYSIFTPFVILLDKSR